MSCEIVPLDCGGRYLKSGHEIPSTGVYVQETWNYVEYIKYNSIE